jgi:hypothetical protein
LTFTEQQIESLSPNPAAFIAGKKLSTKENWQLFAGNERALWGEIKGSGKSPYYTQIDTASLAYKCSCPSRQFPCKHSIALMLLYMHSKQAFEVKEEPGWVKEWLDKRGVKEKQKSEAPKERTEEEQEQLDKNKEKTQLNRLRSVMAGATELELWLKDLVRIGLLELPNKPKAEIERIAARMVDAKAPGLAGWVKAFGKLNFDDQQEWQHEALNIASRLFLLIRTLKNYENLSPEWQQTIKNLSGWSQSTKELVEDPEAETVKDQWLAVGQEVEVTEDEITIQRNWLIGCRSNRTALILNFGTKFTSIENNVLAGSVMEAEVAFFPSVLPQRAAIKIHRQTSNTLDILPPFFDSWGAVQEYRVSQLKINPWANDHVVLLKNALLMNSKGQWSLCDEERSHLPVIGGFDFQKTMKWLAVTGNRKQDVACVLRNEHVIPLGVFQGNHYTPL